jgi:hypothetical protein
MNLRKHNDRRTAGGSTPVDYTMRDETAHHESNTAT